MNECIISLLMIWVIPTGIVEHQTKVVGIAALPGVGIIGGHDAVSIANLAPGSIAHF